MNDLWLKDFEKKFGKGVLRDGTEITKPQYRGTGSLALDIALGGGWGQGRVVQLMGIEGSGKTLLFDLAAIEAQRVEKKHSCIFDFEGTYDINRFIDLGGDPTMLKIISHETIDPMLFLDTAFDIEKYMLTTSADYACYCFDSTGACITSGEFSKKMEEGQDAQAPFLTAKCMSEGLKITGGLVLRNETKPTVFFVSQGRDNMNARSFRGIPVEDKQTGGRALEFYASQRVKVSRGDTYKGSIEALGLKDIEVGHVTKVKVKKNKMNGTQGRVAQFDVYNEGLFRGIDRVTELVTLGVYARTIERSGAWYTVFGTRVQGVEAVKDLLSKDAQVFEKLYSETSAALAVMMDGNKEDDDGEE